MDHRSGESGNIPFRSERFFQVGNDWYFTARGGEDRGPFETRDDAKAELQLFMRDCALANEKIWYK